VIRVPNFLILFLVYVLLPMLSLSTHHCLPNTSQRPPHADPPGKASASASGSASASFFECGGLIETGPDPMTMGSRLVAWSLTLFGGVEGSALIIVR
jgi:hypothetical protein